MASCVRLIDKPEGITSYDVIRRLKKSYPRKTKIGHAGTLDPMATGLLIVGVGKETKNLEKITGYQKIYRTTINLIGTSDTGDRTGTVTPIPEPDSQPTLDRVRETVDTFVAEIEQIPSIYSAIKINGTPAYEYARKGEHVEIPVRKVTIHSIQILDYSFPLLSLEVVCSKGTYIRSLGEDIGKKLGLGGYLTYLRRIKIGDYHVDQAEQIQ